MSETQQVLFPPDQPVAAEVSAPDNDPASAFDEPSDAGEDEFRWFESEDVVVEEQPAIAVYRNRRNHVVIRAQGDGYREEDQFIFLSTDAAIKALIAALKRELGERS